MIQRIQSIYLLVASLFSGGLIFVFDLWENLSTKLYAFDLFSSEFLLQKIVPVLFIGSALISLFTIFQFKNRQSQFVLGRLNILVNLLLLGVLIYLSQTLSGETSVSEKGIGMFLPVVVVLFVVLANRAIKKDEDLVKSVDRLR